MGMLLQRHRTYREGFKTDAPAVVSPKPTVVEPKPVVAPNPVTKSVPAPAKVSNPDVVGKMI